MGSQDSTPRQDDYFILQHLSKMSLQNMKKVSYYLISPKKDANINSLLAQLRVYFKIDCFPSLNTLRQQMIFVHKLEIVKVIITEALPPSDMEYMQKETKISQIITYGTTIKENKIAGSASDPSSLLQLLNSLEEKDSLAIPANNLLFLTDQDTKTLNRYRLNYHCSTNIQNKATAKQDFITLARALFPKQAQAINQFERQYDISLKGEERRKMVFDWVFKDSFYWELIDGVTRNTTDPKRLAYLRLPLKDLHESIFEQFLILKKNNAKNLTSHFYIVIDLSEEQKQKLQKSQKPFMLFTSFVKGLISQADAIAQFKRRPNAFMFQVNPYHSERDDKLDFGFIKKGDAKGKNVILNIYNVLKVESVNIKTRKGELIQGVLPIMDKKRQTTDARAQMTKLELDLTRNYDFLEDLMSKVDSQATVLQLCGYFKESLDLYDKKVDFIRKTNQSEQSMNRCLLKKADALTLNGQFQLAQAEYQMVNTKSQKIKVIVLIHLAQLYMRTAQEQKLEKIINQLEPLLPILQKDEKQIDQYYKGRHFLALKTLKKGSYKTAFTQLQKLLNNLSTTYAHKVEGKPIVHDIYRSMAACQSKLGRPNDALNMLNSTLSLQLACEGKTHNVALTETLIQSISRSSGNQQQLSKSLERMEGLSTEIDSCEGRLESSAMVSLNQSMVRINF